jgi:RNA-directed DNA polymerase
MAKTIKNVFARIHAFEHLFQAHRDARRGKRGKEEVIRFELDLNRNLIELQQQLESQTYEVGKYRIFKVFEPKERIIMSLPYRDRVVQHSLCDRVLAPLLDKKMIEDNCASRPGKGTHFGLNRLERFMKEFYHKRGTDGYVLKADISKYFYRIRHDQLKHMLYRHISDKKLLWLLDRIIDSTPGGIGIPIGNMTSQWFAVFYLDVLDRLVKERLGIRWYSRYMDDFVLIHEDREYLKWCLAQIRYLLDDLGLELNDKTQIFPLRNGVDYLGFHSYLTEDGQVVRKLRQSSKRRVKRKIGAFQRKYAAGEITFESMKASLQSWFAHAKHGDTYHLRNHILRRCVFRKSSTSEGRNHVQSNELQSSGAIQNRFHLS